MVKATHVPEGFIMIAIVNPITEARVTGNKNNNIEIYFVKLLSGATSLRKPGEMAELVDAIC